VPAVGDTYRLREDESVTIRALAPERLELDARWGPGHRPPPKHSHPSQGEHFEVLEGELTVEAGRERRVLRVGDEFDVARQTVHRMWNAGDAPARATWTVSPALRTAEMFEAMDGGMNAVRAARILWEFRNEFRLGSSLRG
jgi:mannose-6-phosphate isomerase-like protein (cupin superfamily)